MTPALLLSLAASGLAVGFLSGLVGIGGGVLIVPLLYFIYATPALGLGPAPELHAVVAHATSLFVIVPIAVLATWTYHRAGAVDWRAVGPVAATSVLAAAAASQLAPRLPGEALTMGFGLLLLASAAQLLRSRREVRSRARPHVGLAALGGVLVGGISALLGLGGGIVAIPILIYLLGLPLEKVAATSMAIIVFTATAAVMGYMVAGRGVAGVPDGSIGYVHYLAGLPILAGSMLAVRAGTRVNLGMSTRHLRRVFGILFLLLGARIVVGSVGLLSWPG